MKIIIIIIPEIVHRIIVLKFEIYAPPPEQLFISWLNTLGMFLVKFTRGPYVASLNLFGMKT